MSPPWSGGSRRRSGALRVEKRGRTLIPALALVLFSLPFYPDTMKRVLVAAGWLAFVLLLVGSLIGFPILAAASRSGLQGCGDVEAEVKDVAGGPRTRRYGVPTTRRLYRAESVGGGYFLFSAEAGAFETGDRVLLARSCNADGEVMVRASLRGRLE